MSFETLIYEQTGAITRVTLNRPKALNALNRQTITELHQALKSFLADPEARVMLLGGAGGKAFVAGADISEMANLPAQEAEHFSRLGHKLMSEMESCPKPIIAVVDGFALGGGCELALACDFILASETASFGQPEVNLGLIPGFGGTQRLARVVGPARAKQLLYTGDRIKAAEALRIGLVNEVIPQSELAARATAVAETIAAKAPLAVSACKRATYRGADLPLEVGNDLEATLFGAMFTTEDMREGTAAFMEKRPATFKGK